MHSFMNNRCKLVSSICKYICLIFTFQDEQSPPRRMRSRRLSRRSRGETTSPGRRGLSFPCTILGGSCTLQKLQIPGLNHPSIKKRKPSSFLFAPCYHSSPVHVQGLDGCCNASCFFIYDKSTDFISLLVRTIEVNFPSL
jgi:hypothetical protein